MYAHGPPQSPLLGAAYLRLELRNEAAIRVNAASLGGVSIRVPREFRVARAGDDRGLGPDAREPARVESPHGDGKQDGGGGAAFARDPSLLIDPTLSLAPDPVVEADTARAEAQRRDCLPPPPPGTDKVGEIGAGGLLYVSVEKMLLEVGEDHDSDGPRRDRVYAECLLPAVVTEKFASGHTVTFVRNNVARGGSVVRGFRSARGEAASLSHGPEDAKRRCIAVTWRAASTRRPPTPTPVT